MRIKNGLLIVLFVIVMITLPAYAEFYQYTDQNGVVHFTDNLSEVPVDQQNSVKSHESVESESGWDRYQQAVDKAEPEQKSNEEPMPDTWDGKLQSSTRELNASGESLNKRFKSLQAEKAVLAKQAPVKGSSHADLNAYEQKVREFNNKIEQYDKDRAEFTEKVKGFNSRVGIK